MIRRLIEIALYPIHFYGKLRCARIALWVYEFEYIRHGNQPLIAALDVHTGQVLAECRDRRTQDDLVAFMERVAVAYPGKGRLAEKFRERQRHP